MSHENLGEQLPPIPEEIIIPEEESSELKISPEGKKYEVEEDGKFYGGEYLPRPPKEIQLEDDEDFPPAPEELPHPAL